MKIESVDAQLIEIPLTKTYKRSGADAESFKHVIVKISSGDYEGYGEADFMSTAQDTAPFVNDFINKKIEKTIRGKDIFNIEFIIKEIRNLCDHIFGPEAKAAILSGVDLALWDLQGKKLELPVYKLLGGNSGQPIEVSYTLSADDPSDMAERATEMLECGYQTFVVKVGRQDPETDVERVRKVRNAIGDDKKIRVDANGGYPNHKQAARTIKQFAKHGIEYVEQPLPKGKTRGVKRLTQSIETPIVADESLVTIEDAQLLTEHDLYDMFNIKPAKCGGLFNSCKIAAIAESSGIPCIVGGHPQQEVMRQACRHFAVSRFVFNQGYANEGPGPPSQRMDACITENEIDYEDVRRHGGFVTISDGPGLGCELDKSTLNEYSITS